MSTVQQEAAPESVPVPAGRRPGVRAALGVAGVVGVVGPTIVVAGLFLSLYTTHHQVVPVGSDTAQYMWRAKLVQSGGLDALRPAVPRPNKSNADRPGYPILAAIGRAVTGVTPFQLAYIAPAILAVVIGLAGAALAREALREPAWAFPAYAIFVGASVNVAVTGNGYIDNLVVDGILLAAALAALLVVDGRPSIAGAIFLIAGAAATEWTFAVFFLALVIGAAVLLVPESIRVRRGGAGILATPTARLTALVVGAGAFAAGAFALVPAWRGLPSGVRHSGELRKLRYQLPSYRIPWVAPASAAGAAAVAALPPRAPRLRSLVLLGIWALSPIPAAYLLHHGHNIPAQRILGFALAIPLLAAAAFVGLARFASAKLWWAGRALGALVLLAAMSGGVFLARQAWWTRQQMMTPSDLRSVELAGRYVATTPPGRPVVFVVEKPGAPSRAIIPSFRRLRAFVPGVHVGDVYVYPGSVADALAGRPTYDPTDKGQNAASNLSWPGLRPVFRRNPIIVILGVYNIDYEHIQEDHPNWIVGPGIAVARGPRPTQRIQGVHVTLPLPTSTLVGKTVAVLLLLFMAGLGWAVALLPGGWLTRSGSAPAFGVAGLALAGLVADRLGFRLIGGSGIAIAAVSTAAGWALAAIRGGLVPRALARVGVR